MMNPFTPGGTVTLAVDTNTDRVALSATGGMQARVIIVAGGSITFIKFGSATVEAAVTDTPVLPGTVEIFTIPPGTTHIAAIVAASTSTIYITRGDGE